MTHEELLAIIDQAALERVGAVLPVGREKELENRVKAERL